MDAQQVGTDGEASERRRHWCVRQRQRQHASIPPLSQRADNHSLGGLGASQQQTMCMELGCSPRNGQGSA